MVFQDANSGDSRYTQNIQAETIRGIAEALVAIHILETEKN
jgi:hypothetical protein